jgi:hypothetical protein
MRRIAIPMTLLFVMLAATGCENENERLARMASENARRQAEQSQQMAGLQREVAQGARELVEAEARAREEMVSLQREMQSERTEIGRQRDQLEEERRDIASHRRTDSIIGAAITGVVTILACVLPLVLCLYLLHRKDDTADEQMISQLLVEDLVADSPLLLTHSSQSRPALGYDEHDGDELPGDLPPRDVGQDGATSD